MIRRAESADVPWLLEQLRAFAQFYGPEHSLFPDDDEEARDVIAWVIRDHLVLIAQRDDNGVPGYRLGLIGGLISAPFFNKALLTATEVWWWVMPEYRGSTSAGGRLLVEFEEHARRVKAKKVALSLLHKSIELGMIDPASLTRRGYTECERTYVKSLPPEDA